jgi:twitching motility protein PilT
VAEQSVMVVNDDAAYYEEIKQAFAACGNGFEVFNAISGARALGLAAAKKPAAVVVDGDMTGLDGYQLTEQLHALPELAECQLVILVSNPTETTALKARKSGAAAHMQREADAGPVVEKICSLVGAARPEQGATKTASAPPRAAAPPAASDSDDYGVPEAVPDSAYKQREAPAVPIESDAPGAAQPRPQAASAASVSSVPHIDDLLWMLINRGGSDLHITVGSPPGIRLRGDIIPLENQPILTAKDTMSMILNLLSEEQRRRFETELELDFAYSIPGVSRFRANVFQQRNSMGAVFRVIPLNIPTMEQLSLPKVCKFLAERPRGLVLVTGPTGSGKSTTLAAMIDHINTTRPVHIITLEDPIEFMHRNKRAYVNQREVGEDTRSFAEALKRVLRQDPDVILVGEMRDLETIAAAITAAETGHLVLATLHTTGGPETVDRIIDVFPPHQQQQVRMQLSSTLEGVLSQVLLRTTDGKSRTMAMEIMLGVPAIANLIREGKTHQMTTIIQGGAQLGMQTLDQHLRSLLQSGRVTYEEALAKAQNPRELAQMVGKKV